MRSRYLIVVFAVLAVIAGCIFSKPSGGLVLYAQTVPTAVRAQWSPNVAADGVLSYQVTLDGGTPITVVPTVDVTCSCVQTPLNIPAFGSHTVTVTATNLLVSTDPNSGQQSSAPTLITFSLNRSPSAVTGGTIKKQ